MISSLGALGASNFPFYRLTRESWRNGLPTSHVRIVASLSIVQTTKTADTSSICQVLAIKPLEESFYACLWLYFAVHCSSWSRLWTLYWKVQWLKLSRQRAFWACKYSYVFHKMFNKELFDGDVHMSSDTWYEHTRARRVQQSKSRNHQR